MRTYRKAECSYCHHVKFIAAHGLCRACFARERINGTPDYKPKRVRASCIEPGCDGKVVSHGRCDKHRIRNKQRTVTITLSETPSAIYQREWRSKRKEHDKNNNLKKSFGFTLEQYQTMLKEQDGKCAICGLTETKKRNGLIMSLAVDHCHANGNVRKLLCSNCNHGLGNFKDDPTLLRAAANYLDGQPRHYRMNTTVSAVVPDFRPMAAPSPEVREVWIKEIE